MTTREEKLDKIKETIWQDRNIWNEYEGDFWVREVMVWDVLDYSNWLSRESDFWLTEYEVNIVILWTDKRNPIQDQEENCIDYIYSIIESDK